MISVPTPIPLTARPDAKPTAFGEPSLHGAHRGNVRAADAQAHAEAVGRVDFSQAAGGAGTCEADSGQEHADDSKTPRAPPVGERTTDNPKAKIEKAGK